MKTMKKKLLCVILVFALSLSVLPASAALWDNSPEPASRQMVSTALWQMAGEPYVNYVLPFTDVAEDAEYADAVRWAASEEIVNGVGGGLFQPDADVNREQLATMLYRYAISTGMDLAKGVLDKIMPGLGAGLDMLGSIFGGFF